MNQPIHIFINICIKFNDIPAVSQPEIKRDQDRLQGYHVDGLPLPTVCISRDFYPGIEFDNALVGDRKQRKPVTFKYILGK